MDYDSCEHAPLVDGGKVIETFSTTQLHISLGVGEHVLSCIEKEALKIYIQERNNEYQFKAYMTAFECQKEICDNMQTIKDQIENVNGKIQLVIESKVEISKDRPNFLEKKNDGYTCHMQFCSCS